jgi:SAM-dependent methyltransferase
MIGAKFSRCPSCGPTLLIKLSDEETKVRCTRCIGTPIALSQIAAIQQYCPNISKLVVYEASSRGAVLKFLRKASVKVVISEYFDGVPPGDYVAGIQCQDLESLTFPDNMFDLCTNTEVMEHVSDDIAAFREMHRVLKPSFCKQRCNAYACIGTRHRH